MKVIIMAGGVGRRIKEESLTKPKPMAEIGGFPLIWHIMKIYSFYGFNEFVITLDYKSDVIVDYFLNYNQRKSDFIFDMSTGIIQSCANKSENWKIHFYIPATGRQLVALKKALEYKGTKELCLPMEMVLLTKYSRTLAFHDEEGTLAINRRFTRTKVWQCLNKNRRVSTLQKTARGKYINGGFLVLEPKVIEYIKDETYI